jgi:hypothetical protein
MAVRLSALRTGRALLPRNIIFLLLILIYVRRLSKPQDLVRPEGLGTLKKFIHLIGDDDDDGNNNNNNNTNNYTCKLKTLGPRKMHEPR